MYNGFYRDKTILVTGIAGFKGSWLALALLDAGAGEVIGLDKEYRPRSNFITSGLDRRVTFVRGDIRDTGLVLRLLTEYRVDVVFHLAAQAIVKTAFQNPLETVGTNVLGTAAVLDAVRRAETVNRCVVATSDKAYGDKGGALYVEDDPLRGTDVYSASKSAADILAHTWFVNYFKSLGIHGGIVRCGNIIGGGDWSPGRIVVDCAKALAAGRPPDIHNPDMVRDYFYVLDAVSGYLCLGSALDQEGIDGEGFNFGPHEHDVRNADLATRICTLWETGRTWRHTPPSSPFPEIPKQTLSWEKARTRLNWAPAYTLDEALCDTVAWYKGWARHDRLDMINAQLVERHRERARERGLAWASEASPA